MQPLLYQYKGHKKYKCDSSFWLHPCEKEKTQNKKEVGIYNGDRLPLLCRIEMVVWI